MTTSVSTIVMVPRTKGPWTQEEKGCFGTAAETAAVAVETTESRQRRFDRSVAPSSSSLDIVVVARRGIAAAVVVAGTVVVVDIAAVVASNVDAVLAAVAVVGMQNFPSRSRSGHN